MQFPFPPKNENEADLFLLCSHLQLFIERLREIPPDKWDWQPEIPAPSARILAVHAWQWLVCDRQHIGEPDALKHPRVPEPPDDQEAMCDLLEEETQNWFNLIMSLTPEQMLEPRRQFNNFRMNIRGFVVHMIQNVIYKHGQLSTIYFMLGLDGSEPYDAPFPNPVYNDLHNAARRSRQ